VSDRAAALRRIPRFSELSRRQLKRIGADVEERAFSEGTSIVEQGWKLPQHVVGVLVQERARTSRANAESSLGRLLAEIAP